MPILLCALAVTRAFAAQTTDTNADFLRALAQFSLGLDGAYGDEGPSVASSLDSMARGLDAWDAAIRTAEAMMRREIAAPSRP